MMPQANHFFPSVIFSLQKKHFVCYVMYSKLLTCTVQASNKQQIAAFKQRGLCDLIDVFGFMVLT